MARTKPPRKPRQTSTQRRKAPPAPKRRWRLPLDHLVRLKWAGSLRVPPQPQAAIENHRVWLNEQDYQIDLLDPARHTPFSFEPNRSYLAIPIDEPGPSLRYLLVREQKSFSAGRNYLVVSEPGPHDETPDDQAIAHIHLLGGYVDRPEPAPTVKAPRPVGVAEAILTPIIAIDGAQPPEPPAAEPLPIDEDLLHCIDGLNGLQEHCPDVAPEIAEAQKQFHAYVQDRYHLTVIPICRGQTVYAENGGHHQAGVSRFSKIDDGIITAVQSDGYICADHELARPAQVMVNRHATQIVKLKRLIVIRPGRLYVELHIPEDRRRNDIFLETARQAGALDLLYARLAFYRIAQAPDFKQAFGQLDHQPPSDDLMRDTLLKVHDWPLRLIYLYSSSQLILLMHGEATALQALHRILHAEALQREGTRPTNPNWLLAELRELRPNVPSGLKIQEFDELTAQLVINIGELLDQITFAPEFVDQQRIDDDRIASSL